jgi:hypothetical protein
MLTILVFEIKEGINAQLFLIIYHYLMVEKRNNLIKSILLNKDKG